MESECEAPQLTIFSQYGSRIDRSVKKRFLCDARKSVLSTSAVSSEIGPSVRDLNASYHCLRHTQQRIPLTIIEEKLHLHTEGF